MNRADEHRKFCAAYRALVPSETPDRVEEAFARWWAREGHETAMERGERVHREAKAMLAIDPGFPTFKPINIESKIKKMKEAQAVARPVLMLHDEVIWDVPTNVTNARPAYRCENKSCPERPPVRADKAPKCYTCDRPMSAVAIDEFDLLLSKDGDLQQLSGVAALIENLQRKIAASIGLPAELLKPLKHEPDLDGWYVPPNLGSPMWGPSPLAPRIPYGDQLAELRNMTPQAWGRYMRGENPPPQIPRKPKDDKEEKYRVGDAIRHQILIGTGEVLDKIGRLAFGLFRAEAVPGTEIQRETDESFRGRMLAYMEPRQLPAGEDSKDRADPGEKIWKAIPDARPRVHHTVKQLLGKLDKIEIDKRIRSMARGTEADVMHAFGMIEGVKDVRLNTPEPGLVEVVLEVAAGASVREIENEARAVCYKDLPVGVEYRIRILYNIP